MFKIMDDKYIRLMFIIAKYAKTEEDKNEITHMLGDIDINNFYQVCLGNEFETIVGDYLVKELKYPLPHEWKNTLTENEKRLTILKGIALDTAKLFNDNSISIVILKNGGIMLDIANSVLQCPMGDIDSLILKNDFMEAHQLLVDNGFVFKFRSEYEFENLEEAFLDGSTEYYKEIDGEKFWFELSWRAIAGRWIRRDLEPSAEKLIEESYFARNSLARVLSDEDNLLQVCVHTAKHSYVRAPGIRLHVDVDRIVSSKEIDWTRFIDKVKKTHVKVASYYSLLIPSVIFNTKIPVEVISVLKPNWFKRIVIEKLLKKVELTSPHDKKFNKFQFVIFQVMLYDSIGDILKVLCPSIKWLKNKYGFNNAVLVPFYIFVRLLDLIGFRKKKQE